MPKVSSGRRHEQRRKKYCSSSDDADGDKMAKDNVDQLEDVDVTSTPACQRLINYDDHQTDDIRTSSQGRRHTRCVEKSRDATACRNHALPPPPPPPSRGLLPAVSRREFIETSF